MVVSLDLKPELEEKLRLRARAEGLLLEDYMQQLLENAAQSEAAKPGSILDLEGVGAELWQGIDAQEYVNQLRAEWDS